ncbi:SRPBCC family protein [Frankia sp. CNm7]|uniref:SRPBCC family protein n=1 Tax=Frankia nepalensis TaxID=1836974 RepID=A0A937UQW6_9ACTN|nr:SRPBCC family protein [Frankia nepalensis]MBL7498615.1 SRPBCC family protein [Frankia nepalensis]MBL7510485.1 SRPBCC family protein [Frankia nepalensis]MBL7517176.1 SRPBCC family protein [Frankia nepalensis]MBL7630508.1 SRPBCC family protein [Frankia nepalensis]
MGHGDGGRGAQSYDLVVESDAPASAVFALLADGAGWSAWAGPFVGRSRWYRTGTPAPGGVGAIREVGRLPFLSREEILEYVPPRRLVYTILSGIPVRDYRATVDLDPLPGGGTRISWRGSFVPAYRGTGPLLRLVAVTVVNSLARRLAAAASKGATPSASSPSPAPGSTPNR